MKEHRIVPPQPNFRLSRALYKASYICSSLLLAVVFWPLLLAIICYICFARTGLNPVGCATCNEPGSVGRGSYFTPSPASSRCCEGDRSGREAINLVKIRH